VGDGDLPAVLGNRDFRASESLIGFFESVVMSIESFVAVQKSFVTDKNRSLHKNWFGWTNELLLKNRMNPKSGKRMAEERQILHDPVS
jgi:hypothetical protein